MEIKILHMFYDLMNLYGEYGNVNILKAHLEDQGAEVIVDKKTVGDEINFLDYDVIYCGSGTEKSFEVMLKCLKEKEEDFKKYIDEGRFALFTGNSIEAFGTKLITIDKKEEELLGICDFIVNRTKDRITGDTILHSKILEDKLVGFVNKQAYLTNLNEPLFDVDFGIGSDKLNHVDGFRKNNLFATYLIGPLLVKNPKFLCFFIQEIIKLRYPEHQFKDVKYENEEAGFAITLKELTERKNGEKA